MHLSETASGAGRRESIEQRLAHFRGPDGDHKLDDRRAGVDGVIEMEFRSVFGLRVLSEQRDEGRPMLWAEASQSEAQLSGRV